MTNTIFPIVQYRDARAAIAFLIDAFGFTEAAVYGEGDTVAHAQLDWPAGGAVMLSTGGREEGLEEHPVGVGSVYLVVAEPDALFERAVAAGATVSRGLRDEDYGSRGFTVRDPEGVFWSFGTYAGV